jgi:hypothetical protein
VDWWRTADAYATAGTIGDSGERLSAIGETIDNLAMANDYPWLDTG